MHSTANTSLSLNLLRIWCQSKQSWLSFVTKSADRYVIGPPGYFLELPDGSLTQISPRLIFPLINRYPSLPLAELDWQPQFGKHVHFASVALDGSRFNAPQAVSPSELLSALQEHLPAVELPESQKHLYLRLHETGLIPAETLQNLSRRVLSEQSLGQALMAEGVCSWEFMLTVCLDNPQAAQLDPQAPGNLTNRHEWERLGEILILLGKINRTQLECALKIRHDGQQALGQILVSMGACQSRDIDECLQKQKELRTSFSSQIALVGQLLVGQGIIQAADLESAMRNQRVGRQSLERILLSMGACKKSDIDDFARANNWHTFQSEIDDLRLGEWLVKVGTINRLQLQEALRIQTRGRQVLGELLIAMQLCSPSHIKEVLSLQKSLREDYHSGLEKLGVLLLKTGKVSSKQLQQALDVQSAGRQPLGCILTAMNACLPEDVELALHLQNTWKTAQGQVNDRLGEVLLQQGLLSPEVLHMLLPYQLERQLPLGRVLVEQKVCSPEQIITALIDRDWARQKRFQEFVRRQTGQAASHS